MERTLLSAALAVAVAVALALDVDLWVGYVKETKRFGTISPAPNRGSLFESLPRVASQPDLPGPDS